MQSHLINDILCCIGDTISPDALQSLRAKLATILSGYDIQPISTALTPYAYQLPQAYHDYIVIRKLDGLSDSTLASYRRAIERFLVTVQKPLESISSTDVRRYLYAYQESRGVSARSLDTLRAILSAMFDWLASEEYISANPCKSIRAIKYSPKPRKPLDDLEIEQVRSACVGLRQTAMVEFMLSTGCRVAELASCRIGDVDWRTGSVRLYGKGHKYRTSYLNAKAVFALSRYLASRSDTDDALFVSSRSPHTGLSARAIQEDVSAIGERAGIQRQLHPHLLRHTMATMAIAHGMSVEEVQQILGHSSIATTMIYAHVNADKVRQDHKRCVI